MVNYSAGIVYKICCTDVNITDCYVGSTCNFTRRKCQHKSDCNNINKTSYNSNVYQFIRANGGWENWTMVQVEAYEAKDRRDLHSRERYHFEQLNTTLNNNVPNQSSKESYKKYCDNHKEELKIKRQLYCKNNKEKINLQKKLYQENNKDKIKLKKKIYYQNTKLKKLAD
jgi:hypothetical protein